MAELPGYSLILTKFIKMCVEKGEKKPRLFDRGCSLFLSGLKQLKKVMVMACLVAMECSD